MKRYSIMVVQYGQSKEVELCQVDSDPKAIAAGAVNKVLRIDKGDGRKVLIPKYTHVRIVDHQPLDERETP